MSKSKKSSRNNKQASEKQGISDLEIEALINQKLNEFKLQDYNQSPDTPEYKENMKKFKTLEKKLNEINDDKQLTNQQKNEIFIEIANEISKNQVSIEENAFVLRKLENTTKIEREQSNSSSKNINLILKQILNKMLKNLRETKIKQSIIKII